MSTARRRVLVRRRHLVSLIAALSVAVGGVLVAPARDADAAAADSSVASVASRSFAETAAGIRPTANLSNFQAGNIISDAVFFNSGTIDEAQIQAFLESKVPRCESGYTCLKDWYDTSRTTTADAMCGAYSGGVRERASRIIYRVAQACGINPQVILATLQKEQGLVTHVWPSDWRYTIAMGQGCPDTAACDERYYGFFNQVMGAAWQFKRYGNPPGTSKYFTWYAPGRTWNVRYNPNEGCGSSPVFIQNQATANLYYYTPYQPNAAALRAGYGEGDGCSAYGNRNFYNYFTDWFGSTQRDPVAEIEWEYQAQGGLSGLGAPTSSVATLYQNGGGFGRAYEKGSIYWNYSSGAKTVRVGPLQDYYFARSGADGDMGWPILNQESLNVASGSGVAQLFSGGSLYAGPAGTFIVREPLRGGYFSLNGAAGALGWPTGDQSCASGVCRQSFQSGAVISSSAGVYPLTDPVRAAFDAAGGVSGSWGVPVSGLMALPYFGGGFGQAFANGSAYYRSDGAVYHVSGPIRDRYFAQGGAAGALGFPSGAQQCANASTCQQQFQFGWVLWTSAGGARIGDPAIDAAYAAAGGAGGSLGARTNLFLYYSYNGGGFAEGFANGAIFYKPGVGAAYPVTGSVRDAYFAAGGAAGRYGWPTSAMTCADGTCTQNFEGGRIVVTASGALAVTDPVRAAFDAAGGVSGSWGVPVSGLMALPYFGGGFGQAFANGSAYYRSDGAVYHVSGPIRDRYFAQGGAAGALGFPSGAQQCANASTCQQQFQFGWVLWTSAGGARIGDPAIDAAYAAAGGAGGSLGARTNLFLYYSYNGGGFAEGFANGAIFYKPGVGAAYPVTGSVRDAYFAAGGAAGRYGWPTSAMTCADGTCTQNFEGGAVTASG
ncbi:hypothetical protein AB1K54_02640 [Microbacterium sp. BWT-B31]|uniref:LGFP repeat-containing protein n=1 Tax=Microbacterium sp. BWT-B31 TaxID=3232072 RepID=UPI00352874C2